MAVAQLSDSRFTARRFDSRSFYYCVTTLGKLFTPLCPSSNVTAAEFGAVVKMSSCGRGPQSRDDVRACVSRQCDRTMLITCLQTACLDR